MLRSIPPHVRWVSLVVGLLGLSVLIQGTAVLLASRQPLGLVEDYERKAAEWDEHRAQLDRNDDLGWELALSTRSLPGGAELRVDLRDDSGLPIEGARVSLVAFHNANADDKLRVDLEPLTEGGYGRAVPLSRSGLYEFQFDVQFAGERFTAVRRETVAAGG